MKARIEPFLDLLDARYLPLLFAASHQAYTVYLWLYHGSDRSDAAHWFAVLGALGYEFIYIGAVAWSERGAGWSAARLPAVTALVFACAVAVAHYAPTQGYMAVLHVGFPLVAYAYTAMMHARRSVTVSDTPAAPQMVQAVQVTVTPAERPALSDDAPTLSKTARVKRLAAELGVSESTAWRKVNAGEVQL